MSNGKKSFLVCPECLTAHPAEVPHSSYSCRCCHHEWQAPEIGLDGAYFASIDELNVYLADPSGETFRLKEFPAVIGRNSEFRVLQTNVSVSRQHCSIDFDPDTGLFSVTPFKTGGGTYLNGKLLRPDESAVFFPGDMLVLAGVVLNLKCLFAKENAIRGSNSKVLPGITLPRKDGLFFLSLTEEGSLRAARKRTDGTIVAFMHKLDSDEWRALAIDRSRVSINGNAFIEQKLNGGETVVIDGNSFEFNIGDATLESAKSETGAELDIRDLRVGYGKDIVLDNISCSIPSGKLTAILGQSGCGKSTLIKVLSGQKKPKSGNITVSGSDAPNYPEWARRQLALVPQHDVIHDELTVRQCIEYASDIRLGHSVNGKLKDSIVDKAIRETGLEDYSSHYIADLSGGQRKRVNIAVEAVGRPKVLLLDEPTTGLDYATEKQIIAGLRQMSRQGKTVVFVTHSLATIEAADHVIVLRATRYGARVAAEGTPTDVQKAIGIESWDDLYSKLKGDKTMETSEPKVGNFVRKTPGISSLLARYLTIWLNNWGSSVLLLLGLPLLLGVLIRCAVSIDAPLGTDRLIFGLVAMFWVGMNQSVREIVKERSIFIQEHSHGVSSFSYLLSKMLFFFFLTLPQAFLMSVPIMWFNINTGSAGEGFIKLGQLTCPFFDMLPVMWFAGFIGCLLGLLFSAVSLFLKKGEVAAVLFAVMATLPQLLFTAKVLPDGLAKPLNPEHFYRFVRWHAEAPVAEIFSYFTFSRYLFLPLDAISTGQPAGVVAKAFFFNGSILVMAALVIIVITWLILDLFYDWERQK